ncbi:MAG: hypothetical protein IKH04_04255 [Kiritimatiellae bacterium]|nr:hypothetical protein [Kiritimatiellia bacterium]
MNIPAKTCLSLALASLLAAKAAPGADTLRVPALRDAFSWEIAAEAAGELMARGEWNDGRCASFQRERDDGTVEWKITYNDREITLVKTPEGADIRQFAKFLLAEPWRNALERRLRDGAELSRGEREMVRLVYSAWIDSLKAMTSLGYQFVAFRANVCHAGFEGAPKDVPLTDGTIYGALRQGYFEGAETGGEFAQTISAWGQSFDDGRDERRGLLKTIIHGGDRKKTDAMTQRLLNEYFYVPQRMAAFGREMRVPAGAAHSRIELWRRLDDELQETFAVLASIREAFAQWQGNFRPATLSSSQASALSSEMEETRKSLDSANEEAVRRARILFCDFPFVRACASFRQGIRDSVGWMYSRATESANLGKAARRFYSDISGDAMLANIKSSHAANEYEDALALFRKNASDDETASSLLRDSGLKRLDAGALRSLAEGCDVWSQNSLCEIAP